MCNSIQQRSSTKVSFAYCQSPKVTANYKTLSNWQCQSEKLQSFQANRSNLDPDPRQKASYSNERGRDVGQSKNGKRRLEDNER